MAEAISKSHNVSVLLYHLICPAKYRPKIFTEEVSKSLLVTCFEITTKYKIEFIEIGCDNNHVQFLLQGIPKMSPLEIVRIIKSITAREIYRLHPEVKTRRIPWPMPWGGNIWTSGYYINAVGKYGTEEVIRKYVENQGRERGYQKIFITRDMN